MPLAAGGGKAVLVGRMWGLGRRGPGSRASPRELVEAAGIEPASASPLPSALHAYSRLLF